VPITAPDPGGGSSLRQSPTGATKSSLIAFALLVLATVAALAIAQRLKHEGPLVDSNAIWMPSRGTLDPSTSPASFTFVTNYRDDLTVSIVSASSGRVVKVLARGYAVVVHHRTGQFSWNGSTLDRAAAPDGTYAVEVHFDHLDRTVRVPEISFDVEYPTP
jgi:hypothetical protein